MRTKESRQSVSDEDKDVDTGSSNPPTARSSMNSSRYNIGRTTQQLKGDPNRANNNYLRDVQMRNSPPPLPQLIFNNNISSPSESSDSLIGSTSTLFEENFSNGNDNSSQENRREGEYSLASSHSLAYDNEIKEENSNKDQFKERRGGGGGEKNSSSVLLYSSLNGNSLSNYTSSYHQLLSSSHSSTHQHPPSKHHHSHQHRHRSNSGGRSRSSVLPNAQTRRCRHSHRSSSSSSCKCSFSRSSSRSSVNLSTYLLTSQDIKLNTQEDISEFIATLRKERSRLLQEIEQEDEERSAFYAQLENLNRRLRLLPQDYNVGCERWRVEGEMCRIQEALVERLGSPSVMLSRREQRLHSINAIEKTIQRLRQESTTSTSSSSSTGATAVAIMEEQQQDKATSSRQQDRTLDLLNANEVKAPEKVDALFKGDIETDDEKGFGPGTGTVGAVHTPPMSSDQRQQRLHPTIEAVLRGTWPFEKALWHSSPASVGLSYKNGPPEMTPGIMSTSSVTNRRAHSQQQLLTNKVEMVYGLLSMFSSGDRDDMSRTLLAMSSSPDSCIAMRQSGCLPLLIQLLHGGDDIPPTRETRLRSSQALHNIVHSHPDDKRGRREARVLRLLEQIREYSDYLYDKLERTCAGRGPLLEDDMDRHPCPAMAALMKLSFDEDHRHAMCALGGLHAIAELIRRDHEAHGSTTADQFCITLRRYAGMALTNLTFGDGTNKALLCSFRCFMKALVSQLHSPSEDLRQVTASVLRNLSWRADGGSKNSLREVGAVTSLMQAALTAKKESTLKVILSAVWNLSAHCSMNKADICNVEGALAFVCSTLTYKSQSRTLSIIENGGGILRNISSHIAVRDDLRQVLRDHNTLSILLSQLRSPSLTVVSNACGTLWNLSARCQQDQVTLWELGAVSMLRSLINSKHKMISMGSSAALKNLLQARPEGMSLTDSRHGVGLPSLQARKQKALEQELDPSLAETCDNIESSPRSSPTTVQPTDPFYGTPSENTLPFLSNGRRPLFHSMGPTYDPGIMSESRETVASTHSDNSHDKIRHLAQQTGSKKMPSSSEGGDAMELSLQSMAPPSHGVMDVVHLSQEEIEKHLQSQDLSGSTNEIFATGVKTQRGGESNQLSLTNSRDLGSRPDSFGDSVPAGKQINGHRNGFHEAHHSLFSKYVNHSRNIAEVDIEADLHQKVTQIGNKYLKDHRAAKASLKPSLKINNYVQSNAANNKLKETSKKKDSAFYGEDDQPTDFALKYPENKYASSKSKKQEKSLNDSNFYPSANIDADDSVKTFCTEGTPYNFSNSASITDLTDSTALQAVKTDNRKDSLPSEEAIDLEIQDLEDDDLVIESKNSAIGHRATDGTVRYCVEGTPPVLSRFSSVSSLSSEEIDRHIDEELLEDENKTEGCDLSKEEQEEISLETATELSVDSSEEPTLKLQPRISEDKPLNQCDETPLMFSRTTSVSSLSSFDIHSIHDDRSSVVSDLSRLTSGAVSPSDLPDSPSETVPTSPKRTRHSSITSKNSLVQIGMKQTSSVFGDAAQSFNVEDTPAQLSHATSLSSLSFDNEDMQLVRSRPDGKDSSAVTTESESSSYITPATSSKATRQSRPSSRSSIPRFHSQTPDSRSRSIEVKRSLQEKKEANDTEPRNDDETRLAALIQSGMSSSTRSVRSPTSTVPATSPRGVASSSSGRQQLVIPPPPPPPPVPPDKDGGLSSRPSSIPIKTANLQVTVEAISIGDCKPEKPSASGGIGNGGNPSWTGPDTLHQFYTEDTPMNISHSGSASDLSVLSIATGSEGLKSPQSSDDTNKNLLERCIQSGVPKPRSNKGKDKKPKSLNYLPPSDNSKNSLLSPRRSNQKPLSVARVTPAVKVGIVSPQLRQTPPPPIDSDLAEEVRTYAVEGTPAHFSPAASLSDLTVESVSCTGERTPESNYKEIPSGDSSPQRKTKGIPVLVPRTNSTNSSSPYTSEPQSRVADCENGEVSKGFFVENMPTVLSRHSSVNSISAEEKENSSRITRPKSEAPKTYRVEDTPANFSRNSSLSSLSLESCGDETTAREQALLQKCINQGMPKSKSDLGDGKKGTSRIPAPSRSPARGCQSGIPLKMTAALPPPSPSVTPKPQRHGSSNSLSHIEAESCKLYSETEENEKKGNAFSAPVAEQAFLDEHSLVDDLTPRTGADSTAAVSNLDVIAEKRIPASAANHVNTSEESISAIAKKEASPLHEQIEQSSPNEYKMSSSDESPAKDMQKSTPSWNVSTEGLLSDVSISESGVVAVEALRLAKEVANETRLQNSDELSQMSQSIASMSDFCLEQIKPPSAMDSLLSLSNSIDEMRSRGGAAGLNGNSRRIECRHTRKLPEMVRRALGEQEIPVGGDGGSLTSSCHSNLDNIHPPSLMDDDMESSMISVASIQSEVVEPPKESPPSMSISIASEAMAEIVGPAQLIASLLQREAQLPSSSATTLVAGDEGCSTYQEITDFDHDETLGAHQVDGTTSDTEMIADDLLQDVPELPFDSPIKGNLSGSPRMTVKDRKSQLKESYRSRTYSGSSIESSHSDSPKLPQKTARQRRAEDSDRFRTRTISAGENQFLISLKNEVKYESTENPISSSPAIGRIIPVTQSSPSNSRKSFRQRRVENPSRYQTRTIEVPLASLMPRSSINSADSDLVEFQDNDDLNLTPEQLEVLSQDANIVICSLNENREGMMGTEENIMDIETLSLISIDDDDTLQQIDEDEDEMLQVPVIAQRPRIVKPGESIVTSEVVNEPKGIRGRRKALYSRGRPSVSSAKTTSPPLNFQSKILQPGSPKLPRATRASTLRQNSSKGSSSSEEGGRTAGSSPGSSTGSSPRLGSLKASPKTPKTTPSRSTQESPPHPLRRQNTFTKDDSESPSNKQQQKTPPTQSRPLGLPKTKLRKDSVQPTLATTPTTEWNQSRMRPLTQQKSTSLTRDVKPPSAKDMAEWNKDKTTPGKMQQPKKDVTSRIASLWKRVEKAQQAGTKQLKNKDSRIWIGKRESHSVSSPKPLARSSTFEKMSLAGNVSNCTTASNEQTSKIKLGLKFSRLKGRTTKSSPPSEASTPVDPRPQCLVSPTRVTVPPLRPRPVTHPSSGASQQKSEDDGKTKRLSRLGSFIVVEQGGENGQEGDRGTRSPPLSIVPPFNYKPPSEQVEERAPSLTRIPQPSKPVVNNLKDDNGNATTNYVPTT